MKIDYAKASMYDIDAEFTGPHEWLGPEVPEQTRRVHDVRDDPFEHPGEHCV